MLAIFGIGQTELLIVGLVCCCLVLPVIVTLAVVLFLTANKGSREKHDS